MFGKRLRHLRRTKDLTQADIADHLGVSPKTVSHWENETREPDLDTIHKIARFLETSMGYLGGETDDPRPITMGEHALSNERRRNDPDAPISPESVLHLERLVREFSETVDKLRGPRDLDAERRRREAENGERPTEG